MEWKSLGLLELSTLPTIGPEHWIPWVWAADVLLVDGGDAAYLCHWMREAGMTDLLPSLSDMVWVGVSAGSMVMTPRIGADFVQWPSAPDDRTLGVVDFSIFPHLDVFPENTIEEAERWARQIGGQAYALDERDGNESGRRRRGGHLRGAMENVSLTAAERGSALRDARSGRDT